MNSTGMRRGWLLPWRGWKCRKWETILQKREKERKKERKKEERLP